MSTQLRSPHSAPEAGAAAPGGRTEPHPVVPPRRRLIRGADRRLRHLAQGVGSRIGRREFIRKTGEAALVTGLSLSGLLWTARPSRSEPQSPCGPHPAGCGSSPICPDQVCSPEAGMAGLNCNMNCGCGGVQRRVNASTGAWSDQQAPACGGPNSANCWRECCPSSPGTRKRCCDCCVPPSFTNGADCTSCQNSKRRCVCRSSIGSC
jgi:hypothetical protein